MILPNYARPMNSMCMDKSDLQNTPFCHFFYRFREMNWLTGNFMKFMGTGCEDSL